ncbi:MAG: hypothetical protein HY293_00470 [Planctomycetes bacterium]|nr:hypothetical protein [Planctomycetota bacterium]
MGADQDLLFGRIAVNRGFCTQAQLDACLALQAKDPDPLPLGQLLLREGHLTEEQHSEILKLQRKNLAARDPVNKASRDAILIGRLAVREKMMSQEQVNACLRLQAHEGEKRSLGEIMVAQGHLTPAQLKTLLARQQKRIMSCPRCGLSFTVLSTTRTPNVSCPRCKGVLQEGKPSDSVRTDAHLETSVAHKMKKDQGKAAPAPEAVSSVRKVKMTCPMCAKPFHEPVDSKGRVDCPSCHSSFSA